jgi:riboflavin kinase/FMN adenylyltransferase
MTARPVAIIGVFDGVHRGHRALLEEARTLAGDRPVLAMTFDPHPQAVIGAGAPSHLATVEHRIALLCEAGADQVEVVRFDAALAALSPSVFVSEVLAHTYDVSGIVVGENFRFGARAAGDVAALTELAAKHGIDVWAQPLIADEHGRWSSTRIRALVRAGDVAAAADGLNRLYRLDGVVVHGAGRGRTLGYPTANVRWASGATVPADGVYAGWMLIGDERLAAAISVGTNPQFDGQDRTVEAYVLDRDDLDLYGCSIGLEFAARLRGQERFADTAALQEQMALDVRTAKDLLLGP